MEVLLTKAPGGALIPMDDEQAGKLTKIKGGATVRCEIKQMRNAKFFRKWWVLVKYAYDLWADHLPTTMTWRGQRVQPEFERFRKDLTIMAGYFETVFDIRGDVRVQAQSLAWGSMDEETFERLYSATIQAVLTKIEAARNLTEEQLREYVDNVIRFAH
jgi:hypothetical protein